MRRPSVFVSSTFYDLKQLRSDIKSFIESLGLEPVLSEYNTFPIDPELGTVDNCLKAVEVKADIFLLVVGGRYGSTTDQGKSITNLEFLTAKTKGVPLYVFVTRSVLDVLPLWESNPSADFSRVTDSTKLFEFVVGLREKGETWVFPFEMAQDIVETLRTQLAYLFQDALSLRTRASVAGGLSPKLRGLSGSALRLVIERPPGWEYLLFSQVLQDELRGLDDVKRDWQYAVATGPGLRLALSRLLNWFQDKLSEASRLADNLSSVINRALPDAMGPPGVSGNPEAIAYVANRFTAVYRSVLEWKLDFERVSVPSGLEKLKTITGGLCDKMVSEIEDFTQETVNAIPEAVALARKGQQAEVKLTLKLTIPDANNFTQELGRVNGLVRSGALDWD